MSVNANGDEEGNVRKAGSSAEMKVAGRSVKKSLLNINVDNTLQSGKRKNPKEIGGTPKQVRRKRRRSDQEAPQVCLNCGQDGHLQRECTEPEKIRQYTDEEGNVKESYVPEEDSEDIVAEELYKSGINFAKYENIPVSVTGENIVKSISQFQEAGMRPLLMENVTKSGYKGIDESDSDNTSSL